MNFFDSLDYRDLLRQICEERKKQNSYFSYRWLSKRTGIASTGFLSLVLNGKRNISNDLAIRLSDALKFSRKESAYFLTLVRFNQAENPEEKKSLYEELLSIRPNNAKSIEADKQEYFNKWYYSAIRELVSVINISDNYKEVAECLIPQISIQEVQDALKLLCRLEFIQKNNQGIYIRNDILLTAAGSNIDPGAIRKYQSDTMDLAKSSLYSISKEFRDISTVTLSTNEDGLEMIKKKIEQCRSEIMAIAGQSKNSDRIIQLNMQLFPLYFTRSGKK